MDKMTINGVEFTEKEIEAIEKEYDNLLYDVSYIEESCGYDKRFYNSNATKVMDRYEKLRKLVKQIHEEKRSRKEIFKEQLEMKITEALKEDK